MNGRNPCVRVPGKIDSCRGKFTLAFGEANMATNDPRGNPPYGPWSTFTTFVSGLHGSVVPDAIDGSLTRNLSGSASSQLRGALRFFGLVEGEKDVVTDRLRELVAASADKEQWQAQLAELVPGAYAPITDGLNLQAGTRGQLDEAFRDRGGVTGSVNRKAVRFFLSAMVDAGQSLSPHFGAPSANGARSIGSARKVGSRRTGPRKVNGSNGANGEAEDAPPPPAGHEKVTCSIPGGRTVNVLLPSDLAPAEEDFLIFYLQGFFKLRRHE